MPTASTITEVDILSDVIASGRGDFPTEVAKSVLSWKFTERAVARMSDLAQRNSTGMISPAEREELDKYVRVGNFINLLQAKARLSLRSVASLD